ncbi:TetR/AcrR family transcriptional regulator [Sciscionella marina]|uniref:TetR/AcrR family transcriptional regulator n=1 Tax=Sciscionella marina TaxID=508770 RepID=UPI00036F0F31|nr:TetR/AcrR family transcriptional regulator [Sciscionella marina]
MSRGARERLLSSAVTLFRRSGIAGCGVAEILAHSGAGRGSIYTHFPGGKAELAEEAVRTSGQDLTDLITTVVDQQGLADGLHALIEYWRDMLRSTGYAESCPILSAALQNDATAAQRAAGDVFRDWHEALTGILRAEPATSDRADTLATLIIAAVEGAIALARGQHSLAPLDAVEAELAHLLGLAGE